MKKKIWWQPKISAAQKEKEREEQMEKSRASAKRSSLMNRAFV